MEWVRSTLQHEIVDVTGPKKYRRYWISGYLNEGHSFQGFWKDSAVLRRFIWGVVSRSRIMTLRAPAEIQHIILDQKMSEFRRNGPPRGNLIIIFDSPDGVKVFKKSKCGELRREIEALEQLQGFNASFPVVAQYSKLFDWFVTDYFPNVAWSSTHAREEAFLQLLESAHQKLGTSSKNTAQLIRESGLTNGDIETSLKIQGLCSAEIVDILSGDITIGLVYGSRPSGNVLKGASNKSLQLIDFEKAHRGPIIIDFERLWDEHHQEIRQMFSRLSGGGGKNLSADQQIVFWRSLQANGIHRKFFQGQKY